MAIDPAVLQNHMGPGGIACAHIREQGYPINAMFEFGTLADGTNVKVYACQMCADHVRMTGLRAVGVALSGEIRIK